MRQADKAFALPSSPAKQGLAGTANLKERKLLNLLANAN
jgi:hypothetical protein